MSSTIEFKLFAPHNIGAALIGSFCECKEIPMKKGEDGYFCTQIALEDGVYQYKFRIQTKSPYFEPEQWVDVIDPYATDVDEERNNGVVRIKDGKRIVDAYVWQHDDTLLPNNQEIIIYEMHVADFSNTLLSGYNVPNFPTTGIWHEWIGNYVVEARENEIAIDLPEYEVRVFVLQP